MNKNRDRNYSVKQGVIIRRTIFSQNFKLASYLTALLICLFITIASPQNLPAQMAGYTNQQNDSTTLEAQESLSAHRPGKLIVKINSGLCENSGCELIQSLVELNEFYGLKEITPLFPANREDKEMDSYFTQGGTDYLLYYNIIIYKRRCRDK